MIAHVPSWNASGLTGISLNRWSAPDAEEGLPNKGRCRRRVRSGAGARP